MQLWAAVHETPRHSLLTRHCLAQGGQPSTSKKPQTSAGELSFMQQAGTKRGKQGCEHPLCHTYTDRHKTLKACLGGS